MTYDISSIGNIIPGLIASWMDRQHIQTISVILIIAISTRLIMIIMEVHFMFRPSIQKTRILVFSVDKYYSLLFCIFICSYFQSIRL